MDLDQSFVRVIVAAFSSRAGVVLNKLECLLFSIVKDLADSCTSTTRSALHNLFIGKVDKIPSLNGMCTLNVRESC